MMTATPLSPPQNGSYLENLNPEQRAAVEHTDGPTLVLAGAGTGKTRVLTTRLAHILHNNLAFPSQILAVTFTNKAAQEMKYRVSQMLGGVPVEGWWLGTFHSLGARILRHHAECVGLQPNFTILDEDDQIRLLKQLMQADGIDPKKWPPRVLLNAIQKWKDKGWTPDAVPAGNDGNMADGKLLRLYKDYQARLQTLNATDFGDLLLHVLTIFRDPQYVDILTNYQNRFRYILVDEYQDTNTVQYLWLRLLAQAHKNICCVGDDDQSIYGWRGADIGNILKFEKDFPGAKIVRLEQNYRSTQNILHAANTIIAHNSGRLGKELWSAIDGGEQVCVRGVWDGQQEARAACEDIESLHHKKTPLREIAILVRAAHQMRAFEEKFSRDGVPYRVIGGPRFYERQEIRDAIAYLRVIAQPDDDLAFERIINVPKRGLGPAAINKLRDHGRMHQISLYESLSRLIATDTFRGKQKNTLTMLVRDFERWRLSMRELPHTELAQIVLDESGYTAMWQADKTPEAPGRLENLKELVSGMGEFESINSFLEHIALVMENTDRSDTDMVTIMTLHAAKGLEFDHVYLPGWEEGLFPSQRSMDENGIDGLEEERRLAYVGLTRARKKATILFSANRLIYGSWTPCLPSRFIEELPKDSVDVIVDTGLQSGSGFHSTPARSHHHTGFIEAPAAHKPSRMHSTGGYAQGDRVFHQKFGYGDVISVSGDKLDISFDKAGRKKLVERFVERVE